MKKIIIFFVTFILIKVGYSQNVPKIRINPAHAYGGNIADYFDSIEYIPLETKKESLFGEVTKLVVTDSSYVIYDWDTKSVLFFNLHGQFLNKVSFPQNSSINMSYLRYNRAIIVSIFENSSRKVQLKYYSQLGVAKKRKEFYNIKELENSPLVSIDENYSIISGNCYLPSYKKPSDSIYHLINIYKGGSLYKTFLPITQSKNTAVCMIQSYVIINRQNIDKSFYISSPLDNKVYQVTKDTTIEKFQFIFPYDRVLSKDILLSHNEKVIDNIKQKLALDETTILGVDNIFYYHNFLFFKINPRVRIFQAGSDSKYNYNFIYDTLTSKLFALEKMNPDASTYYLPVFDQQLSVSGLYSSYDNFYTSVSSLRLFTANEKTPDKAIKYPPVLKEYFKTQSRKSNPVIVRMKLKDF